MRGVNTAVDACLQAQILVDACTYSTVVGVDIKRIVCRDGGTEMHARSRYREAAVCGDGGTEMHASMRVVGLGGGLRGLSVTSASGHLSG